MSYGTLLKMERMFLQKLLIGLELKKIKTKNCGMILTRRKCNSMLGLLMFYYIGSEYNKVSNCESGKEI